MAACNELMVRDLNQVRSLPHFEAVQKDIASKLFAKCMAILTLLQECMVWTARIRGQMNPTLLGWASANLADIQVHLNRLVYPGFLAATPSFLLVHLPRYLKALSLRQDRALLDPVKDQVRLLEMKPYNDAVVALQSQNETMDDDLFHLVKEVEELNVQVFAQELSLKGTVSAKRLAKRLAEWVSMT
jgi:ATP-dependent helicase HrpA